MKRRDKKGQFNFGWLFAILAGGAILLLAIYGAMRTGDTASFQSNTEIAKSISIITDPLQAGFATGSKGKIEFQRETQIRNICYSDEFGRNDISVATRESIKEDWSPAGVATSIYNKYIFSPGRNSGTDYYVFSKPFYFPYKVSDLIFLISENYCFIDAPDIISDEIIGLKIPNIEFENCILPDTTRVCFSSISDCDIKVGGVDTADVENSRGVVSKNTYEVAYVGNLMYAAIFSDETNYNCNVQRLLYRTEKIAEELIAKSDIMRTRGCSSAMKNDLVAWANMVNSTEIEYIGGLTSMKEDMGKKNDREQCNLW